MSLKKFFQFLCYTREKFMMVSNLHKKASLLSNFFKENLLFFLYFFSIPIHSVSGLYVNKTTRQKDSFKSSCFWEQVRWKNIAKKMTDLWNLCRLKFSSFQVFRWLFSSDFVISFNSRKESMHLKEITIDCIQTHFRVS